MADDRSYLLGLSSLFFLCSLWRWSYMSKISAPRFLILVFLWEKVCSILVGRLGCGMAYPSCIISLFVDPEGCFSSMHF